MIKLANSIALPLGTSQESSDFKAFLESILPPEPEYGEPCPAVLVKQVLPLL